MYATTRFSGRQRFNLTEGKFDRGFSGGHRSGSGASLSREPRCPVAPVLGRSAVAPATVGSPRLPPRAARCRRGSDFPRGAWGGEGGSDRRQPRPLGGSQARGSSPHPAPAQVPAPSQQGSLRLGEFLQSWTVERVSCLVLCSAPRAC